MIEGNYIQYNQGDLTVYIGSIDEKYLRFLGFDETLNSLHSNQSAN